MLNLNHYSLGIKSVMFDSVFWWRSPNIEDMISIDAYIVQDFLGVDHEIKLLGKQPSNLYKVGAVFRKNIDQIENRSNSNKQILINYGGIESPYIKVPKNSKYPFMITDSLSQLFTDKSEFKFIVTGKNHIMQALANRYKNYGNVRFETLEHHIFLSCIASSDLVITTPGIETFYETVYFGKRSVLLLPHNSTQYLQLLALIDAGIESPVCTYNYYGKNYTYKRHINESEEVKAVLKNFNDIYSYPLHLNKYIDNLYQLIENRLIEPDIYEINKQQYLKNIGTNGGQSIVKIVEELIN